MITFKKPISLTDYKKLINLGVNVTAFEYRAIHNNGLIRTIFGTPRYLGEQLTAEEQYQIAYNIATEVNAAPLGITSIEATISRNLIDKINSLNSVLLVDLLPAVLKTYISMRFNIYGVDVNINDLYWVAEELNLI